MNQRQLQYAIQLSKTRSFSALAEKLNISQPALSKQIQSLEKEVGVKLFDRNKVPLSLTPAGEHFIKAAEELVYKEEQVLKSMEEFKSGEAGNLVIGISPFRSLYLIPSIVEKVRKKYPKVKVLLNEKSSDLLRKEVEEGKYDFAIINLPVDESVLDATPLEPDTLVLAVPNKLLSKVTAKDKSHLAEIDIKDCKNLPFVTVGESQEMRKLFDKLCKAADFTPNIAMEVVGVTTAWAMAHTGVGATLLPLQFISDEKFDDDIALFKIKNNRYFRQPAIVTRRGEYLSEYAKFAMNLLTEEVKNVKRKK